MVRLDFSELWSFRELGYFFVWRDVKVRYKQTLFGALWAVAQPVALMVVFSLFLGQISGIAPTGIPYPAFVLAALVPWTLLSKGVVGASESLVSSENLIQKVYFPRLLLPLAALGLPFIDFLVAGAALLVLVIATGITPSLSILWVVPLTGLILLIALGAGIWLSAVYVRYRDVRQVVPLLVQLWLFASPVAYGSGIVPADVRWLYYLNPMAGAIDGFRWALLGGDLSLPVWPVVISVLVSIAVLISGLAYFRRFERTFADVI